MTSALFDTAWGAAAVALAVGCLVLVATLVVLSRPRGAWLKGRLEPYGAAAGGGGVADSDEGGVRETVDRAHGAVARALGRTRLWRSLALKLDRAHVAASPAELVFWAFVCGLGAAVVTAMLGAGAPLVAAVGLGGAVAPLLWVSSRARARMRAFEEQLPDVLMSMAASLKVGQSFENSMRAIVDEGNAPVSEELGRVLAEARLGRPLDDALAALADRVDSEDLRFVVMSVTIQREVGGSLAQFFDTVSDTVRQRQQFRRKVRALTATGRMSARLLLALPFVTAALIALVGDGYLTPLFTTTLGQTMVTVMLVLMVCGWFVIRRIVDVKG